MYFPFPTLKLPVVCNDNCYTKMPFLRDVATRSSLCLCIRPARNFLETNSTIFGKIAQINEDTMANCGIGEMQFSLCISHQWSICSDSGPTG